MTTFIALLRGVNVGKAKRVPMADFRKLLTALGYTDVVTLLNSGNAVFRSRSERPPGWRLPSPTRLARKLKVEVPVIVKSSTELAAIVAANPFRVDETEYSRFLVAFTQEPKALEDLAVIQPYIKARRAIRNREARSLPALRGWDPKEQGRCSAARQGRAPCHDT